MRFCPLVLVVSLALLESGSQASKVRGTAAFDRTTEAASVADNQHGLSLLPATKDEDRMFKNLFLKPDAIVKKHLEELIPFLGESSSSARPHINVQGATSSTAKQGLHTLSDEQKIRLGVNFIHRNSLEDLITAVKPFMRTVGKDAVGVIFSAMCKHLGEDVATKVLLDVEKAGETSGYSREKLMEAQFKYWQKKRKSDADVFASLRKLESEDEKVENYGRYAVKLDEFIHFRNNGKPDDESLFDTLTHGDGMQAFAVFISEGISDFRLLKADALDLQRRYYKLLEGQGRTVLYLFDLLKLENDGPGMFIGPKFDLMTGYAAHSTSRELLGVIGKPIIGAYIARLGTEKLQTLELRNNAKYMVNLLFQYFEEREGFDSMIEQIKTFEDGEVAAEFLVNYRSWYIRYGFRNFEGLKDPFKARVLRYLTT